MCRRNDENELVVPPRFHTDVAGHEPSTHDAEVDVRATDLLFDIFGIRDGEPHPGPWLRSPVTRDQIRQETHPRRAPRCDSNEPIPTGLRSCRLRCLLDEAEDPFGVTNELKPAL